MNDEARRQAGSERNVNRTDPNTRAWSRQLEGAPRPAVPAYVLGDRQEAATIARHDALRAVRARQQHLVRSATVAAAWGAHDQLVVLGRALARAGLIGLLVEAEARQDGERIGALEQALRRRVA